MDKIICIGKNYLDHAQELGDAVPERPVIFLKPPSTLIELTDWNSSLKVPLYYPDIHYETEIILKLKQGGYRLSRAEASTCIDGVSLGFDLTRRSLQTELKKQGHPWTIAKVFPAAAIAAPFIPLSTFNDYLTTPFSFTLNGKLTQQSTGNRMLLSPLELICYISEFFPLNAGDLIYTGTPAGVGALHPGDEGRVNWGNNYYFNIYWEAVACGIN